jgi:serine/threonine-protein phosphatase 2A regulatory subunit B'
MSIPAGVAASIANQVKASGSDNKQAAKPIRGGQVAADLEQVKVQTPGADRSALKDLPPLRDSPPAKREELFIMKLKLCSVIFSFDDPIADKRGKDMKRQTLLELVDYVNTPAGQKIFTESVMGDLMAMVSANVCRALPPATDDFDPEEDEPVLEPAWPHLQVAYEFFLRFIVSSEVNAKAAKKYVDQKFCLQLVELFDSEDPRERDYLKTILHRIYGKFMSHRSFIRRAISNVFYRFVYETERHNGIGELLEILGSIINGFAIPLKKEHLQFLVRALIPLHKPKCVALYHQQLSYCIIQYVEKDADTATPILNGFFKCWPWSCSGKQVMFLNELEEILELLGADQLAQVSTMLFTNLARCLDSDHFQVVERALFLWNNEHLVNSGCLSRLNAQTVLPIIYGPLYKNSSGHWNATVEGLAQNVLKMYMEYDLALYDKCTAAYFREEEEAKKKMEALAEKWNAIEQMALAKRPALMAK